MIQWHQVEVQNRGPEQENPGRDLRKTDSTEVSIFKIEEKLMLLILAAAQVFYEKGNFDK